MHWKDGGDDQEQARPRAAEPGARRAQGRATPAGEPCQASTTEGRAVTTTCLDCGVLTEMSRCDRCFSIWNRERLSTWQQREIRSSRAWRRLSEGVRRERPWCVDCESRGEKVRATQVHHPDVRSRGGDLLPPAEELVGLCDACHAIRPGSSAIPVPPSLRASPPAAASGSSSTVPSGRPPHRRPPHHPLRHPTMVHSLADRPLELRCPVVADGRRWLVPG